MEQEDGLRTKFTRRTKFIVSGLDAIILILILFHYLIADLTALTTLGNDKILLLISIVISIAGFIISYKDDGIGGLIILYGFLLFWIVNFVHDYNFHFQWITGFFPLSGIMHIFVWRRSDKTFQNIKK